MNVATQAKWQIVFLAALCGACGFILWAAEDKAHDRHGATDLLHHRLGREFYLAVHEVHAANEGYGPLDPAAFELSKHLARGLALVEAEETVVRGVLRSRRTREWMVNVDGVWEGDRPLLRIVVEREFFAVNTEMIVVLKGRTPNKRILKVLEEFASATQADGPTLVEK